MATRVRTRLDRPSLGLERLELEDGQGQGGEQELESKEKDEINCMDNFSSFKLLCIDVFHFGMETTW